MDSPDSILDYLNMEQGDDNPQASPSGVFSKKQSLNPDQVQDVPEYTEEEATEIQAMEVGSPIPSQSLSSDFEVPPSSRKVISSEETVTVNKVD